MVLLVNTNGPTVLNWNVATISGGEFKVNSTATSVIANGSFNNEADKGQLTITGGQFTSSDNGNGNLLGYGVGRRERWQCYHFQVVNLPAKWLPKAILMSP